MADTTPADRSMDAVGTYHVGSSARKWWTETHHWRSEREASHAQERASDNDMSNRPHMLVSITSGGIDDRTDYKYDASYTGTRWFIRTSKAMPYSTPTASSKRAHRTQRS